MTKFLYGLFSVGLFILGFYLTRPYLGSLFLTLQLSSNDEIKRIKSQANLPYDFSSQPIFANNNVDYLISQSKLQSLVKSVEEPKGTLSQVLGTESDRWIEVDLSEQRLNAWEGGNKVYSYLVSTGKWAPTPTGDFNIWTKLAKTKMSGGSQALGTYYYLPNVPCVMYFYKGYGIHGTYWHNNFGQPMSHGCVNMRTNEACELFAWASVGTRVSVHQ